MTQARTFVEQLATLRLENVFNPYTDACPDHDRADAPAIRRENLIAVMDAALSIGVDTMWFGRDLGYRGGRRTGLALTDEAHLSMLGSAFGNVPVRVATTTAPIAERTAQEIWKVLCLLSSTPFLWNVFPLHPHEPGRPMSNRCHTVREARACEEILSTLLNWFKPRCIIALGKDAHRTLARVGYESTYVRHPSYGGQAEFAAGILSYYGLPLPAKC